MKNLVKILFASFITVLLSACSGGIPKCGDKDVQNVLTDIMLDSGLLANVSEVERKKLKFTYGGFMSELTDKEAKTQHCKAQMKISGTINSRPYKYDRWINYSAHYTDDKQIYVEMH
ncbi:hypothetical protein CUPS4256_08295 [Campylobacter upsaliensis]|uniref:hypothetical protein n=1 Tax=Campylobacter upsaliensis TaxID=28080 RepID=UPI00214A1953|nr:hypothetical protein [Campylobacter upsaliensis]MCR2103239.1 hypothetical protein [Campylobacter upsaliensis]